MPAWIHDRAMELKKKMKDTYGPEKAEQVAFAVATQQAHKVGKSPKTFVSKQTGKKEPFGTPEGKRAAKMKFDKPKSEYKKMAANKIAESRWAKLLRTGRLGEKEISKLMERGVFDINRHGTGMFKGVERIQNAAAKKGKSLDMWEAMEKMKHLSENRVKIATDKALNTILEINEESVPGVMPQPGAQKDDVLVNELADTIRAKDQSEKESDKQLGLLFSETGEDATQEKTVKVAMYCAFSDEFQKIAAAKWRAVAQAGGKGLERLERGGLVRHARSVMHSDPTKAPITGNVIRTHMSRAGVRPKGQIAEAQRISRLPETPEGLVQKTLRGRVERGGELVLPSRVSGAGGPQHSLSAWHRW